MIKHYKKPIAKQNPNLNSNLSAACKLLTTLLIYVLVSILPSHGQLPTNVINNNGNTQIESPENPNSYSQNNISTTTLSPNKQTIFVPIDIVPIQFEGSKNMSSTWGELESLELINQLNQIYRQYGIQWKLNTRGAFKIKTDQYTEVHFPESLKSFTSKISRALVSPGSGPKTTPIIYVIKNFPKGVDEVATPLPDSNSIIFSEKSESRGKGSPYILAHELAHLLGLTDIPINQGNLMSVARPTGAAGTKLYSHQLSLIRKNASKLPKLSSQPANNVKTPPTSKQSNESIPNKQNRNSPTIFKQIGSRGTY